MIIMKMMQLTEKVGASKKLCCLCWWSNKKCIAAKGRHFQSIKGINIFFQNPLNKFRRQAFLKSYLALRCKQINKRFVYYERNNCQDILSSLLKSSDKKLCCLHLEADTARLFLFYSIRGYDQITPVLIDSKETYVVVICVYAASIINGEFAIRRKRQVQRTSAQKKCLK